jgi:hypothetical protein
MSKNSQLKRYLTHLPFGVILFALMMAFALVASIDARAEGFTDAEAEAYYAEQKEMVERGTIFIDEIVKSISAKHRNQVRHALHEIMDAAYNKGFMDGAVDMMESVEEADAEDSDFVLDPDLGCITDMECEIGGITYRGS